MATLTDIIAKLEAVMDKKNREQAERLYPVGIIVESYTLFDPATQFGLGTWERLTDGRVLVSADDSTVGTEGGADSIAYTPAGTVDGTAITVDQMPSHAHSASTDSQGGHAHDRGNMEIYGAFRARPLSAFSGECYVDGAFGASYGIETSEGFTKGNYFRGGLGWVVFDFYASRRWSGSTNTTGAHGHNVGIGDNGGGQAHDHGFTGTETTLDVRQKWRGVYRWRRTA